ncbi:ABC transporter permease [Neorhizobium galegae]|uniref:ABC transporter permease n=1 Tax=Neorhizobium galegae TaxID=399 RepID=UPI0006222C38|nr:ABC transporter permease [Neorhizobium galegae]CDZ63437.1 ABC-type dipeptide/oligopeptide/nickel transport system, permease component [Neorhizobium galegae bv. orientalis]KAB1120462.1 ABC transporter permease [Neorhizobium galegae]MCQ1575218.1 ABC transporter permease [Neorhizobium galegae]MCQ1809058.1 ABC transporter permease [Neorhizobium galegae]MCQ1839249.1 ABC transporter permease [Neorhizobium galegae]
MTDITSLPPETGPSFNLTGKDIAVAGQWRLFWLKFKKHRIALASLVVIVIMYLVAAFADFIAPFDPNATNARFTYAPPQGLSLFHDGSFQPNVKQLKMTLNTESMRREFVADPAKPVLVGFFVKAPQPYHLLGLIPMQTKLFGLMDPQVGDSLYIFGADRLGRDIFSRVVHGAQISLSIGLVGVFMSLILGVTIGGISGFFGGWADLAIQRFIELLRSIPTIPLWMGLAAAIPVGWPPLRTYFVITLIVSLIGWTSLAREVRGKFLSLRSEDFVIAARLDGMSEIGIIFNHLVPSFMSHIIATLTLAIPSMILAETALSFLGIGLQPPIISWGVLLQEAQNIRAVAQAPWLLFTPAAAIVISVLSLNFLGDGLRDAADPYESVS